MNILAVIPARYASTRFPGKPLAMIGDKPMIEHVWDKVSAFFDYAVVATDDGRIIDAVDSFGGKPIMTSASHRSGTDRCAEALDKAQKLFGMEFDVVVNVQGDEPFVSCEQFEKITELFRNPEVLIGTLVRKFSPGEDIFNPNTPKVAVGVGGTAVYFSRSVIPYHRGVEPSQWAGRFDFYKHIGLYAYRAATLKELTGLGEGVLEKIESLEQLRWLENGYRIYTAETFTDSLAIDTPQDLENVISVLNK